jgi:hypothetical protein
MVSYSQLRQPSDAHLITFLCYKHGNVPEHSAASVSIRRVLICGKDYSQQLYHETHAVMLQAFDNAALVMAVSRVENDIYELDLNSDRLLWKVTLQVMHIAGSWPFVLESKSRQKAYFHKCASC